MSPADITSQITECQTEPQKGFLKLQEALIRSKEALNRPRDREALRQLESIRQLRRNHS